MPSVLMMVFTSFAVFGLLALLIRLWQIHKAVRRAEKHTKVTQSGPTRMEGRVYRLMREAGEDFDRSMMSLENDVIRSMSVDRTPVRTFRGSMDNLRNAFIQLARAFRASATTTDEMQETLRNLNVTTTETGRMASRTSFGQPTTADEIVTEAVNRLRLENVRAQENNATKIMFTFDWEYDIRSREMIIDLMGHYVDERIPDEVSHSMRYRVHVNVVRMERLDHQPAVDYVSRQVREGMQIVTAMVTAPDSNKKPDVIELKLPSKPRHGHAEALAKYMQKVKCNSAENNCDEVG